MAAAVRTGGHLELRHTGQHLCALPSTSPSARSPEPFLPIKDAPPFTTTDFTHGGWLSHPTLEKAVAAMPFISTDETRHVLQGILITTTGHLVATDGRKLAHAPTRGTQLPRDIILPTRMIKAFEALANGTVTASGINHEPEHRRMQCWLTSDEKVAQQLLAHHSGCYLRARLIEGNFPNWRQVLPGGFTTLIDVSPEFLAILKVTLARSTDKKRTQVLFDLQPNGSVTASIHESGGKERTDLIDPCAAGTHSISADQPLFACCWNAPYLLACLQFSGLRLYAIDSISPFRSGDPSAAQTVLMPMRVNA
jgi:DNA polymerase-3 subunit beta